MRTRTIQVQTLRESVDWLSTAVRSLIAALPGLDLRLRRLKDDRQKGG